MQAMPDRRGGKSGTHFEIKLAQPEERDGKGWMFIGKEVLRSVHSKDLVIFRCKNACGNSMLGIHAPQQRPPFARPGGIGETEVPLL